MSKKEIQEPVTTYTIHGKGFPVLMVFKYGLNGIFKSLELKDGEFSEKFRRFLFNPNNFPYFESDVKNWEARPNIKVEVGEPEIDFDTFWNLYNYKVGKPKTIKEWKKLPKTDQIKAISQVKAYDGFLRRKQIAKVYPERYLKHRRFEDQFNSIH